MKFSACCITQSRRAALPLLVFLPLTLPHSLHAQAAPSSTAASSVDLAPSAVVEANTLQKEGKRPFHLKVTFQVFDLQGKAADEGTLEYWWAGPDGSRLNLTSAVLGIRNSLRMSDTQSQAAGRSLYLLQELLDSIRSPGAVLDPPKADVLTETRTVGGVPLACMHRVQPPSKYTPAQIDVCADTVTGTIRLILGKDHEVTRNRVARFGQTRVALETALVWGSKKAITGHVDQLQSFDPSASAVVLEKPPAVPESKPSQPNQVRIAGGVLTGSKIGGAQPTYPIIARQERVQGTVVLAAEISEKGKIARLIPLMSPDPSLTEAATDAVSTWTYTPYLLNGEPVSVSTTITVNFNLP